MSNDKLLRTKPLSKILGQAVEHEGGMKRVLGAIDLTAIGVGAIIGAGIFVLTGTAARDAAGPSIMLSYIFAGFTCILAALCYAEFATAMPISGSAYTYAYATVGELVAWIIGWDLILEYTIGASTVAVGWTHYLKEFVSGLGWEVPPWMLAFGPSQVNLAALALIFALTALLCVGVKESARVNAVMVIIKLAVVVFVIFAGFKWVKPENWNPFAPNGLSGIIEGSALIFFAYIGFDAVSTAAEEVKNPKRDLPIGIIASLVICTGLYVAVSAVITGMVPYAQIDPGAPLAAAFGTVGNTTAQFLIGLGGFVGLTTVVLVLLLSQPRIWFAMARDGLLMPWFAKIHPKTGTPINSTILAGLIAAFFAAAFDMNALHHMVSVGTLFAFVVVSGSILVLRYKEPSQPSLAVNQVLYLSLGLAFLCGGIVALVDGEKSWAFGLLTKEAPLDTIDAATKVWAVGVATKIGAVLVVPGVLMSGYYSYLFFSNPPRNAPTSFACPWVPAVPILAMVGNILMMVKLNPTAWIRLFIWLFIGFVVYFGYGRSHSKVDEPLEEDTKSV